MSKRTKRKKLIDKLDGLCKDIIRERDKWTCQHCRKVVSKSNAHCSHVIPRSRGNALRWVLENLKLLCYHCHINWWHKSPVESGQWFKDTFPVRWAYLESNLNQIVKFTDNDLEELYKNLKQKYNELVDEVKDGSI